MAKLSTDQIEQLSKIGIKGCKTTEDSREKMVEKMVELGIEDDGEDWDDIYEIVSTLLDDPEAENDELAEEVDSEDDEDEEDEDDSEEDEDEDDEDEEEDEDDEDEEDEIPAPKKSTKKVAESSPKKPEAKKEKAAEKTVAKPAKKVEVEKKISKRLNPKENKEDAALYDGLKKALSKFGEFEYNFIANGGVSIKYLGKNSTKVFFSFDSPKLIDKSVVGRVYSSAVKTDEKLAEMFGEDFEIKQDWSGIPIMVEISLEDIITALKDNKEVFDTFLKNLEGKDVKLGKNREKMEEQLKETQKEKAQSVKKSVAKTKPEPVVEEDEDDEDEEDEIPAPKKSTKKVETKVVDKKKKK